ncbi:putative sugar O-methyltransferase [Prochlorococcus marinus]|uniref:putative sugar O-methyltransferase n=1 Tax=Prochlorococcus marinus TaxID=1219 RepID=UPI001ADC55EE|nr:putative sugar O-methyltransferase [Prochlorococcus marinus]MBO8221242.1 putative sugar O-methyltransferase [Prochlorococcus marinus CUG1417]
MFKTKSVNYKECKSVSDNGEYPELALKAALDPVTFSVFRRHHNYTRILEHVSRKEGEQYLNIIRREYKMKDDEIFQILKPLMKVGNPKLLRLKGLSNKISTTGLRYLKIALDIKKITGRNIGNVVEIGCGYGGQAIILDQLIKIESYTFYDLWQVNLLIKRFIEDSNFSTTYTISTIKEDSFKCRNSWDFCISNYAFSELPKAIQEIYINKILNKTKKGFMLMNSGVSGKFGKIKNHSQKELLNILRNASIYNEIPLTHINNYLLTWGGDN